MTRSFLILLASVLGISPVLSAAEVQCAILIYGGTQTSRCFSDEFLSAVQRETTITTERRFKSVKLATEEVFGYPFAVMTGEADFHLAGKERENLKRYLENGGFLLASAGCSSKNFDEAFRREMRAVFPGKEWKPLPKDSPIFRTVYKIDRLDLKAPAEEPGLLAMERGGKIVAVYSPHGLNNTANSPGCCCCGGNEIKNSLEMNVNILAYALLY
ncbi:MAG: DUF4159 domain-containing protein [Terrimicrobiaceae bacterium]